MATFRLNDTVVLYDFQQLQSEGRDPMWYGPLHRFWEANQDAYATWGDIRDLMAEVTTSQGEAIIGGGAAQAFLLCTLARAEAAYGFRGMAAPRVLPGPTGAEARMLAEVATIDAEVLAALTKAGFVPTADAGNLWFFDRGDERLLFGPDGSDHPWRLTDTVTVASKDLGEATKEEPLWSVLGLPSEPAWDRVERIARAFVEQLEAEVGPDGMEVIARTNRERNDETCASHDLCDANVMMDHAFVAAGELRPSDKLFGEGNPPETEADVALWNDAWRRAKQVIDTQYGA